MSFIKKFVSLRVRGGWMKYFFIFLFIVSCASRQERQITIAEKVFDLIKDYQMSFGEKQAIALLDERNQLDRPIRMAVYFTKALRNRDIAKNFNWTYDEKDQFIKALDKSPIISRVFELIRPRGTDEDIRTLRLLAAQQGADTLLMIQGAFDIETHLNASAISYLFVLPAFFVKGNEVKGTFISQALLWDVKSPIVHLGVQSEGKEEERRPIAFRNPEAIIEEARGESLEILSKKLNKELDTIL